jgi:3-oxoacyl-[acyl-carrier protein] reductase
LTQFANKVVLVTGGASGIGAATTRAFAREGAKVAFTWITSEADAKAIEAEINAAGGTALAIKADLTSKAEVDRTFALVADRLGPLDVLFANAGGILDRKPATETPEELWAECFDINVTSTFLTCQAALKVMAPRKSGSIVTMTSLAAFNGGGPGASHYAASKGAVVTYTRGLAKEYGPAGIRVNGVAPGLIATRFHDRFNTPAGRQGAVDQTPLRREGTSEDVAEGVLFLASEKASFITGEILQINGGLGIF